MKVIFSTARLLSEIRQIRKNASTNSNTQQGLHRPQANRTSRMGRMGRKVAEVAWV